MASEMLIDMSQLAEAADAVRKTRRSRTIGISRDVGAVLKPAKHKVVPPTHRQPTVEDIASLAGAAGTLAQPLSWDEEVREIAWNDHITEKFDLS